MKKRIISILLCVAMVAAMLPGVVLFASAETYAGRSGGVTWSLNTDTGLLKVSGSGKVENDVGFSGSPWYEYRYYIKEVEISGNVTNICDFAFYECRNLKSITIPDSVTEIGKEAFCYCAALEEIPIPDTVTHIGGAAFYGTSFWNTELSREDEVLYYGKVLYYAKPGLTGELTIKDGTVSISDHAFSDCKKIDTVHFPASLRFIDQSAFYMSGIRTIEIPDTVSSIEQYTFAACENLTEVTIPESVTQIKFSAFASSGSLTDIFVPDSVTDIGDEAFQNCTKLSNVRLPDTLTHIGKNILSETAYAENPANSAGGVLYYGRYVLGTNTETVSGTCFIKDGTVGVADCAFYGCQKLTEVVIPDSVKFMGCNAFYSCRRLSYVSIGSGLSELPDDVFSECQGLMEITIPANITKISTRAFGGCSSLKTVVLTNSVTEIGNMAFLWCGSLAEVYFYGTEEEWNAIRIGHSNEDLLGAEFHFVAFGSCGDGVYWTLDPVLGVLDVFGSGRMNDFNEENPAPWSDTEITSVYIDNGVTAIGDNAFAACEAIEKVYFYGTQSQWDAIEIGSGNENLTNAPLAFLSDTGDPCCAYIDIDRNAWYHEAADFVIANGLMGSTSTYEMKFEPNTTVSRAMVASIIYRLFGSPKEDIYHHWFTDVKIDAWYADAVFWCAYYQLAAGKGNGIFDPNGKVTRQELAMFMRNTAAAIGEDVSKQADLNRFADAAKVPSWSKEALAWAVDAGILSGKAAGGKTYLAPTDTATRAELAAIIMRFMQKYAET